MAKSADIGSKRLISLNPDAWVHWVMGDQTLRAGEFIDPQFQWVSRDIAVLSYLHFFDRRKPYVN